MPKKIMLFNTVEPEEVRGAILEDGVLVEYDIESHTREKNKNNIYYGTIVKVEPSIQACFVDYGGNRHGFLPFGDIDETYWSNKPSGNGRRPRIDEVIRTGQNVLVQVVREEVDQKGAALTTYFSLPGRYVVLMARPGQSGISRKIEERSERKALREIMRQLNIPDSLSYILRTSCVGRSFEEVEREIQYLVRLWRSVKQKEKEMNKRSLRSALIFQEADLVERMIRDYYDDDVDGIYIDERSNWEKACSFIQEFLPNRSVDNVRLYKGKRPLFSQFGIEHAIQAVYQRKIALRSGGSIVIDPTEALVSIDVNSGKTQSDKGTEETALKANLEAAEEIARQLRLRDLGGLVVIDFISMRGIRNVREVEKYFRSFLKKDKARIKMGRISSNFGLLSLSRQRIRDSKEHTHFVHCPSCNGAGKLPNVETSAMIVLRELKDLAAQEKYERVDANLPQQIAYYLLNQKREEIFHLERHFDLQIYLFPRGGLSIDLDKDLVLRPRTRPSRRQMARESLKESMLAQVAPPSSVEDDEETSVAAPSSQESKAERGERREDRREDRKDRRSRRNRKRRPDKEETGKEEQHSKPEESTKETAPSEEKAPPKRDSRQNKRDSRQERSGRDKRGRHDKKESGREQDRRRTTMDTDPMRFQRSLHSAMQEYNVLPWFLKELEGTPEKPRVEEVARQFNVSSGKGSGDSGSRGSGNKTKAANPEKPASEGTTSASEKFRGARSLIPEDAEPEDFIPPPPPPAVMP